MQACRQCRVEDGELVRATHLCPGPPPAYESRALCAYHAAPYKTARPLPLET